MTDFTCTTASLITLDIFPLYRSQNLLWLSMLFQKSKSLHWKHDASLFAFIINSLKGFLHQNISIVLTSAGSTWPLISKSYMAQGFMKRLWIGALSKVFETHPNFCMVQRQSIFNVIVYQAYQHQQTSTTFSTCSTKFCQIWQ